MVKKINTINKNPSKKRILFVGEGVTMAHILRPLTLAKSFLKDYEVFFAADHKYKNLIESHGVIHESLACIDAELFLNRLYNGKPAYQLKELQRYVLEELPLIYKVKPDVIISDFRITLNISSELTYIPHICLTNGQWSPHANLPTPLPELSAGRFVHTSILKSIITVTKPFLFKQHAKSMNKLRETYGLLPLGTLTDIYTSGTKTLYMDIPELFDLKNLPENHQCIGPVHWNPEQVLPEWWKKLDRNNPIIFITPGSSGCVKAIKNTIRALSKEEVSIVVATVGRFEVDESLSNVYVEDFISGEEISKIADVVICNGGSGMVYQSLSEGTPVICLPALMDQYYVSEAVERSGAGICLRSGKVNKAKILNAIKKILTQESFQISASKLQKKIERTNPVAEVKKAVLELLVSKKKPIKKSSSAVSQIIKSFEKENEHDVFFSLISDDKDFVYKVANDKISREKAYELAYEVYKDKGFLDDMQNKMLIKESDATNETFTLLVEDKKTGKAIATITLIKDSRKGLPSDAIYQNEINELRQQKMRLVEITRLTIHQEYRNSKMLFIKMVNLIHIFARRNWGATDFVIEVNPRHVKFYERLHLFNIIGDLKSCDRVQGHPAYLLRLNLLLAVDKIKECSGRTHLENGKRISHVYKYFVSMENEAKIAQYLNENYKAMTEEEAQYFDLKVALNPSQTTSSV